MLAPVTAKALGQDLMAALNASAKNDGLSVANARAALSDTLGDGGRKSEVQLKSMMNDPRYSQPRHPERDAYTAQVAREFKMAYPGDQDGVPFYEDGGLISDGDPSTYHYDYDTRLPAGSYVLTRAAVNAFTGDLLARLNAAALSGDQVSVSRAKRGLAKALGLKSKPSEAELRAMMRAPEYLAGNQAYYKQVADGFRRAYGERD